MAINLATVSLSFHLMSETTQSALWSGAFVVQVIHIDVQLVE